MTAGALYGYYATRDDLVNALIAEVYSALADAAVVDNSGMAVDNWVSGGLLPPRPRR